MRLDLQLDFLLRVVELWKDGSHEIGLTGDDAPWHFAEWIDGIDESSKRPIRHAILYFLFPDSLERSVSGGHKTKVAKALGHRLPEDLELSGKPQSFARLDRALYELRKVLEKQYGTERLDFYYPPLKELWDPADPPDQMPQPLNTILYGPPSTGKTYATARRCVEICDGAAGLLPEDVRERYERLVKEGRVEFITFHQSYGYEEFVEGLRPDTGSEEDSEEPGTGFRLVATDGVLKRTAERARNPVGRGVFRMDIKAWGNEDTEGIFERCIADGYALLWAGGDVDWSDPSYDDDKEIHRRRMVDRARRTIEGHRCVLRPEVSQLRRFGRPHHRY